MDAVLSALRAQHAELRGLLDELGDTGLTQPSRCPGWTVADVLLHLAQTGELARASAEGRLDGELGRVSADLPRTPDIDAWAGALVDHERGTPATWRRGRSPRRGSPRPGSTPATSPTPSAPERR